MGTARAVIRSGVGGLLFGGVLYLAGDTASDLVVYSKLHSQAMQLVKADPDIGKVVGEPYTTGAWYDATLAFSHREKVAHCNFQLKGSKGVTDIAVKAGRKPGYKSNILYNLAGPGVWQLISCQAMVPSEGGLVQPRSLMPEHQAQQQQQQQQQEQRQQRQPAGSAASCQPSQQQQQPASSTQVQTAAGTQFGAQAAPAAAAQGNSWWHRLWWRKQQAAAVESTRQAPAASGS